MNGGIAVAGSIRPETRWLWAIAVAFAILMAMANRAQSGPVTVDDTGASHPDIGTIPPFQPPSWVDERDDVVRFRQWLPDGRLAIAGNTAPRENGYLRIFDPKTGAEEDYYMVGGDGVDSIDRYTRSVVVIGDTVFLLNSYGELRRGTRQQRLMAKIDLGFETEEYAEAASGAILADGNAVLVSWWESVPSKKGYCGDGPVVARLSPEGEFLWRWRDRQGGDKFANNMAVLSDGTILLLVDGYPYERMGTMWETVCGHEYEYLVALSPDGREIARRSVPRKLVLGPLSLGWNKQEAVAAAGYPNSVLDTVVRIRVTDGQIELDRVPIARNITTYRADKAFATSLENGGYEIRVPGVIEAIIDENGNVMTTKPLRVPPAEPCDPSGGKDLTCSD